MLLILANLFCWIPAVFGYGIVLSFPRKGMSTEQNRIEIIAESLFGFLVLSVLVNIINFKVPIDHHASLIFLIIGWFLCVVRLRMLHRNPFTFRVMILLAAWLFLVSFWATQYPRNPDSKLYHMQSIHWLNKSALPFGLANIHARFGYNSSWFSVASVIQLPIETTDGLNCISISALLIYFFGIAVFQALRKKLTATHTIYLALSSLVFSGTVARTNISSPSPDFAVLLLCVFMTYLAIEAIEMRSDLPYRLFQMIVLALFAFTIKPSSLPLLLIPLSLVFFLRYQVRPHWKHLCGYAFVFGGILSFPWILRGVALSGCLNFPTAATCLGKQLWTVPREIAELQWFAFKATARLTPYELVPIHEWVGPWFWKTAQSVDFLIPVTLMISALLVHFYKREKTSIPLQWIVLPHLCALALWFFSAPDIRFAAGYFWSLALLLFSTVRPQTSTLKQKLVIAGLLAILVWAPFSKLSYFGFPPVLKASRNPHNFLFDLPIPQAKTTPYLTLEGIRIFESAEPSRECWLAELPCVPYFNENLRTIRTANGDFTMFYYLASADTP